MNGHIRNRQDFPIFLEKSAAESAEGGFANASLPEAV